jgi:hypothetical protein
MACQIIKKLESNVRSDIVFLANRMGAWEVFSDRSSL